MSATANSQDLRNRMERLRPRVDRLIESGVPGKTDAENLEKRFGEALKAFDKAAQTPSDVEAQVATLEIFVARLETPPSLSQTQEAKALIASYWMMGVSLTALAILIVTNYSGGWFINNRFLGFALAGVAINVLASIMPRISRGDWHNKYLGTYAFRVLQATVYAAVIYQFVNSLPAGEQANIPFAVSGLFVGMFVNLLENAFAGIGERFVDMICALFASKFAGPREKEEKTKDLEQQRARLRARYGEMDKSGIGAAQRAEIEALFNDTLLLLQSSENSQAEAKLQTLELKLDSAAQPALELTSVEPDNSIQGEQGREVTLRGQGFQKRAQVRLQREREFVEGTEVKVISEAMLRCAFDLRNIATGTWDVVVVNPNLKEYVLLKAFHINAPAQAPAAPPTPPLILINVESGDGNPN